MSSQIQHRRGTTDQHATFTGAIGEITVDTVKKTAVVHDGATAGGIPLAKEAALALKADDAATTAALAGKADAAATTAALAAKADAAATTAALAAKADAAATTASLAGKANTSDVYTKAADPIPMAKSPPRLVWVNGTTVTVKAEKCRDELDAVNLVFPSDINVVLAGAPVSANRHVLVGYDGTGTPVAIFSATNALPGGWQAYRRAGTVRTNGTGGIIEFIQRPDDTDLFDLAVPLSAFNGTGSAAYETLALPCPPSVVAKLIMNANNGATTFLALLPMDVTAPASLSATGWNMMSILTSGYAGGEYTCRADANSQIKHAATSGAAYRIYLMGWRDRRGRDK